MFHQVIVVLHFVVLCFVLFHVRATREVSVSHIESVSHFFVHYKSNWEKIDNLQSQLEDFFLVQ